MSVQAKLSALLAGMSTAWIIDASVHMLKSGGVSTFGELAVKHYSLINAPLGQKGCVRVDVVFDQYKSVSIKAGEREKRGESTALEIKIQSPTTPIPKQWMKYISNPKNKVNLCDFLSERFSEMGKDKLKATCSWWGISRW